MNDTICVLIHGFAGSTDEIEYLADYLQNKGMNVYLVSLAGHGSTKKELKRSCCTDWIKSAKDAVDTLKSQYKKIYLLGFSMGGLISAHLASIPEVKKIVFINTPIYFWNIKIILKDVLNGIRNTKFDRISYYVKSVHGVSLKSGVDFLKLLSKSKRIIPNVKKDALIIQCRNDESVKYKSADYIKSKIGASAEVRFYEGGCHQVLKNSAELRDAVCEDVFSFLTK